MPAQHADVIIIGGGAGGAACGITLSRLGARVVHADRAVRRSNLGEVLPPSAAPFLQRLGLWNAFLAGPHAPTYGNRSAWGESAPRDYDFIRSPFGTGWRVDRQSFDLMLSQALHAAGCTVIPRSHVVDCVRARAGRWEVSIASGETRAEFSAGHLVDATGRARWLARRLGVGQQTFDGLVATVGVLQPAGRSTSVGAFTLVEAIEEGWWYSTDMPDGRLVAGYLTDLDLPGASAARTEDGWQNLLIQAPNTWSRVREHGGALEAVPHTASARSTCLDAAAGGGWCAVGDAAAAYDPLSGHGIAGALETGILAAHAIASERAAAYGEWIRDEYARYLAHWLTYYDLERRWAGSPFWLRRHATLETVLS